MDFASRIIAAATILIALAIVAWDVLAITKGTGETVSRIFCRWDVNSHWMVAGITAAIWVHVFIGERLGK